MRIERDDSGNAVAVMLSRRNLLALLAKLDGFPVESRATLLAPTMYGRFSVSAEEDDTHYAHQSRGVHRNEAGALHPATEARIGVLSDT